MEIHLLAIQARILLWVGLGWIVCGLWLGIDPLAVAWRAAAGAVAAMLIGGWLLRRVARVIEERVAADLAEQQLRAQQAAEAEAAKAAAKPGSGAAAGKAGAARGSAPQPPRGPAR